MNHKFRRVGQESAFSAAFSPQWRRALWMPALPFLLGLPRSTRSQPWGKAMTPSPVLRESPACTRGLLVDRGALMNHVGHWSEQQESTPLTRRGLTTHFHTVFPKQDPNSPGPRLHLVPTGFLFTNILKQIHTVQLINHSEVPCMTLY